MLASYRASDGRLGPPPFMNEFRVLFIGGIVVCATISVDRGFLTPGDPTEKAVTPPVHVILCHGNHSEPQFGFLVSHLRSKGYGVDIPDCIRDFDDVFVSNNTGRTYKFWGRRLMRYKEAIAHRSPTQLILLMDVNDVLVMGDAKEAAERFEGFGVPIVASCTEGMWPPPEDCPAYQNVPSQFAQTSACRFPCAGTLMGTVVALRQLFDDAGIADSTNDQCWLHERLSAWPAQANWTLDVDGQLFLDVNRVPQGALLPKAGRYHVKGLDLMPTIIHLPGLHPRASSVRELYEIASISAP